MCNPERRDFPLIKSRAISLHCNRVTSDDSCSHINHFRASNVPENGIPNPLPNASEEKVVPIGSLREAHALLIIWISNVDGDLFVALAMP
jgi:hypothetical protein